MARFKADHPDSPILKGVVTPLDQIDVPSLTSTMARERPELAVAAAADAGLGEQMLQMNRQMLRDGLRKAGISERTIEKLKQFDGFANSAGEFLVTALDLSHRSMVYLQVQLLEEADRIKEQYLTNHTLDEEVKLGWQQAYTDIVEQIGKCYDRSLLGTQAMAKMLGTDKETKAPKKPGFRPLVRATPVKDANG